jgi:predicted ATPase
MVCVVGEPGIGKTTLVEEFLADIDASTSLLLARGNCSERLADTEAYLPVFDALEGLLREDRNGSAARLLKAVAPTWCAQIAPPAADAADVSARSLATSQPAILREFVGFLQEAARFGTLVLFFDDVHWADLSTVDLLAHVGRLCPTLRVLIVATYRPTEMLLGRHPFRNVKLDLQAKGICTEVTLGFLGRQDVARYLDLAFPGHELAADFAELIHARTEGSPLFMADLLRYLCESGTLAEIDGHWRIASELPDLSRELPESIRGMIQRKLDRLDDLDRQVLSAASVQGHAFDSQIVADALGSVPAEVEDRLQALDRVHGLVRMLHDHELPDRSLSLRYAFVHILYQQALYHELLPTRRAWLSLSIARALAKRHGDSTPSVTAELAYLYEGGRDFMESARQFWQASNNAARVFAHSEAISLARRGLKLLDEQPKSPERDALKLKLETTLGMQLQMTQGYAAPAAQQAYERARKLCDAAAHEAALFPVLWGLWLVHKVRSNLATARLLADELAALARKLNDPDLSLQAHQALGMTAFCRGEPETSLQHVEQGVALYDPRRHLAHAFQFGQDPSVICKGFGAVVLWLLGYPDAAARQCDSAIAMSKNLSPSSQTVALFFAAMVHRLRRDVERSREFATACGQVAAEHGLSFWMAGGTLLGGTSASAPARSPTDIIRQGLVEWQATGSVTYRTFFLGLLAEALLDQGQPDEAIATLDEALALATTTEEHFYTAELHRLRGEAILMHSKDADRQWDAERDLRRALAIAQDQQANSLALRAAVSLTKLHPQSDARFGESIGTLSSIFNQLTEGFDTPDVQHAAELLELGRD